MKKKFLLVAVALLPLAGFVSCNDDDDDENGANEGTAQVEVDSVRVTSQTLDIDATKAKTDPQDQDIHYSYDASTGRLTLEVDSVAVAGESQPEFSFSSASDGVCSLLINFKKAYEGDILYSSSIELEGFAKKTYTIKVWRGISIYYTADVDMTKSSTGVLEMHSTIQLDPDAVYDNSVKEDSLPVLPLIQCLFPGDGEGASSSSESVSKADSLPALPLCAFPTRE